MAKIKFQAPRGMRDILPEEQCYWEKIEQVARGLAKLYGFGRIDPPFLEELDLFVHGTGSDTDIVEKEMYTLKTKGGDRLALRPEFTPGVVRAYLENGLTNLLQPVKLFSWGALFRHEKPQKGRYRQLHQANFEVIGELDPVLDAHLIQVFFSIARELGLKNITAQLNSIGCPKCRPNYRRALVAFYRSRKANLCRDCLRRLQINPLRLLDCKESKCLAINSDAPQTIDYLCEECCAHFKGVLEYLDELEIPYLLNPYLVRGMDYYTKTVFEIWPEEEGVGATAPSRQSALAGGGRYDGLVKLLGGKDTPAVGFAMGVERVIGLMKERGVKVSVKFKPAVFLIQLGEAAKKRSLKLFEDLRLANIAVLASFSKNTIKAQMKNADKAGARFALILGQKEVFDKTVIVRDMVSGSQETVPLSRIAEVLRKKLKS